MNPDQKWWLLQTVTCPHCQAKDTVSDGDAFDNAITKHVEARCPTNAGCWNSPVSKCSDCQQGFDILANISKPPGLHTVHLDNQPGTPPLPYRVNTSTPNWWLGAILVCPKCKTFQTFEDGDFVDIDLANWDQERHTTPLYQCALHQCDTCQHLYPPQHNLAFPTGHLAKDEGEELGELF